MFRSCVIAISPEVMPLRAKDLPHDCDMIRFGEDGAKSIVNSVLAIFVRKMFTLYL